MSLYEWKPINCFRFSVGDKFIDVWWSRVSAISGNSCLFSMEEWEHKIEGGKLYLRKWQEGGMNDFTELQNTLIKAQKEFSRAKVNLLIIKETIEDKGFSIGEDNQITLKENGRSRHNKAD